MSSVFFFFFFEIKYSKNSPFSSLLSGRSLHKILNWRRFGPAIFCFHTSQDIIIIDVVVIVIIIINTFFTHTYTQSFLHHIIIILKYCHGQMKIH